MKFPIYFEIEYLLIKICKFQGTSQVLEIKICNFHKISGFSLII